MTCASMSNMSDAPSERLVTLSTCSPTAHKNNRNRVSPRTPIRHTR